MCQVMRNMRPLGQEGTYRFFVGDAQPPNLVLYPDRLLGLRYGMLTMKDVPTVSAEASQRCVQFTEASYVTSSIPLAVALTFQPEVIPSDSWFGEVSKLAAMTAKEREALAKTKLRAEVTKHEMATADVAAVTAETEAALRAKIEDEMRPKLEAQIKRQMKKDAQAEAMRKMTAAERRELNK